MWNRLKQLFNGISTFGVIILVALAGFTVFVIIECVRGGDLGAVIGMAIVITLVATGYSLLVKKSRQL